MSVTDTRLLILGADKFMLNLEQTNLLGVPLGEAEVRPSRD